MPEDQRLGRRPVAVGERRLKPRQQRVKILGPGLAAAELDQGAVAELERDGGRLVKYGAGRWKLQATKYERASRWSESIAAMEADPKGVA